MRKWLAVCVLFLFYSSVNAQDKVLIYSPPCGGVERWPIKVLTDADTTAISFTPIAATIDSLIHITTPVPNAGTPRIAGVETTVYKIRCYITIKKTESDDDYHLVVSDSAGNTLIAETPDPLCSTVFLSGHVGEFISARNFVDSNIAQGNVYNINLPEVDITGVGFIDIEHGQTGAAPNQLELHPVLDIQFAQPIGINEIPAGLLSVHITPNPSHGKIDVSILSRKLKLENCTMQLFDVHGALAAEYTLPVQNQNEVRTSLQPDLLKGTYIYRITNNGIPVFDGRQEIDY